jgi:hypothetical protein
VYFANTLGFVEYDLADSLEVGICHKLKDVFCGFAGLPYEAVQWLFLPVTGERTSLKNV